MKEKVRFAWEGYFRTDIVRAEKEKTYSAMKERFSKIQEAIKTLETILDLSEKAERFGILEVCMYDYGYDVRLENGILTFGVDGLVKDTGMTLENIKDWIAKEGWKSFIRHLIHYEEEQERAMEGFFKEAEPYLTVKVIEGED